MDSQSSNSATNMRIHTKSVGIASAMSRSTSDATSSRSKGSSVPRTVGATNCVTSRSIADSTTASSAKRFRSQRRRTRGVRGYSVW